MMSSVWTRFLPSRDDRSSAVAQVACSGAVHPTDALSLVLSALSRGGNPIVDALSITVRTQRQCYRGARTALGLAQPRPM